MLKLKSMLLFALFLIIGIGTGLWLALDSTEAELLKGVRIWALLLPIAFFAAVIKEYLDGELTGLPKAVLTTAGVLILGLVIGAFIRMNPFA